MKKIICGLLVVVLMLSLCACAQKSDTKEMQGQETVEKTESAPVSEKNEMTEGNFISIIQGYWATEIDGCCYLIHIEDENFTSGVFESSMGSTGNVTKEEKIGENTYRIDVYFPETILFDEKIAEDYGTYIFSSLNGFTETMIMKNESGNEFEYIYGGKTLDSLEKVCYELMNNASSSPNSDCTASYYVGKTAQEVFDDFGYDYFINSMNRGMGFIYENSMWFKYLNYVDFNSQPKSDSIILEVMTDRKGIEIYNGVSIGDTLSDIQEKIGINWYDGSIQAKSYIEGAVITWNLDFADKSIIMATITKA